jgi:hypothetical protein
MLAEAERLHITITVEDGEARAIFQNANPIVGGR